MKTTAEMKKHFQSLVDGKAVYVWGANCEKITEEMTTRLFKTYGTSKYNKAYYTGKLAEGKGRIGADCSGSFFPVSGYDATANGYYTKCTKKGEIGTLPKNTPCMVFIKQSGKMVHIGWYDGAGKVYEMRSSSMNVRHDALSSRWTHWGIPEFVDYSTKEEEKETVCKVELAEIKKGSKSKLVKTLQILLIWYGYSCGSSGADGIFGNKTDEAVRAYQKAKGLTVDGIVGKNTWTSLLK